jgi:hypothetical protein
METKVYEFAVTTQKEKNSEPISFTIYLRRKWKCGYRQNILNHIRVSCLSLGYNQALSVVWNKTKVDLLNTNGFLTSVNSISHYVGNILKT